MNEGVEQIDRKTCGHDQTNNGLVHVGLLKPCAQAGITNHGCDDENAKGREDQISHVGLLKKHMAGNRISALCGMWRVNIRKL